MNHQESCKRLGNPSTSQEQIAEDYGHAAEDAPLGNPHVFDAVFDALKHSGDGMVNVLSHNGLGSGLKKFPKLDAKREC